MLPLFCSTKKPLEGKPLMQCEKGIVFLINRSNNGGLQGCSDHWRETNDTGWEKMHAPPFALEIPDFARLIGLRDTSESVAWWRSKGRVDCITLLVFLWYDSRNRVIYLIKLKATRLGNLIVDFVTFLNLKAKYCENVSFENTVFVISSTHS